MFRLLPTVENTIRWKTKLAEEQGNMGQFSIYSLNLMPLLEKEKKEIPLPGESHRIFEIELASRIMHLLEIGEIKNVHEVIVEMSIMVKEKVEEKEDETQNH